MALTSKTLYKVTKNFYKQKGYVEAHFHFFVQFVN